MRELNISIVLYHTNESHLRCLINQLLNVEHDIKIYLIDNSTTNYLARLKGIDNRIEYFFNNANLGYGKAHNIALKKSLEENVPYHLVLNPDINFDHRVIEELYDFMEQNIDVGIIIPRVLYPDGSLQYTCKLLPTPIDLFVRRFLFFNNFFDLNNHKYELRFTEYNSIFNVPFISGCFMLLRTEVLKQVGLFDERFFMYLEDTDLSRRIHKISKTIFYPYVSVQHVHQKGSYKSFRLLVYHIISAIKYFNKWGWFFDKERKLINKRVLEELGYYHKK